LVIDGRFTVQQATQPQRPAGRIHGAVKEDRTSAVAQGLNPAVYPTIPAMRGKNA
jgi:hypothetical protein